MYILQSLFDLHESQASLIYKILGCIFLLMGSLVGVFFLFQILVPLIGYLESGAIACGVLLMLGSSLLFMTKKRMTFQPEKAIQQALEFFKESHIENFLKNNTLPISLASLVIGVVLSQVIKPKNLSDIYKSLK